MINRNDRMTNMYARLQYLNHVSNYGCSIMKIDRQEKIVLKFEVREEYKTNKIKLL